MFYFCFPNGVKYRLVHPKLTLSIPKTLSHTTLLYRITNGLGETKDLHDRFTVMYMASLTFYFDYTYPKYRSKCLFNTCQKNSITIKTTATNDMFCVNYVDKTVKANQRETLCYSSIYYVKHTLR